MLYNSCMEDSLEKIPSNIPATPKESAWVRANIMTPGGTFILALTIVVTMVLFLALFFPSLETTQMAIVALLALGCWMYLISNVSAVFELEQDHLVFKSLLSSAKRIPLVEIQSIRLLDLGQKFNGDRFVFEISVYNKIKPMSIMLGPFWDGSKLSQFVRAVALRLESN